MGFADNDKVYGAVCLIHVIRSPRDPGCRACVRREVTMTGGLEGYGGWGSRGGYVVAEVTC